MPSVSGSHVAVDGGAVRSVECVIGDGEGGGALVGDCLAARPAALRLGRLGDRIEQVWSAAEELGVPIVPMDENARTPNTAADEPAEETTMAPSEKQAKTGHRGIDTFRHFRRLESKKGTYRIQCASAECKHVVQFVADGKPMAGVAASAKAQMRRHVMEKHRPCSRCGEYGHNVRGCRQPATETA